MACGAGLQIAGLQIVPHTVHTFTLQSLHARCRWYDASRTRPVARGSQLAAPPPPVPPAPHTSLRFRAPAPPAPAVPEISASSGSPFGVVVSVGLSRLSPQPSHSCIAPPRPVDLKDRSTCRTPPSSEERERVTGVQWCGTVEVRQRLRSESVAGELGAAELAHAAVKALGRHRGASSLVWTCGGRLTPQLLCGMFSWPKAGARMPVLASSWSAAVISAAAACVAGTGAQGIGDTVRRVLLRDVGQGQHAGEGAGQRG